MLFHFIHTSFISFSLWFLSFYCCWFYLIYFFFYFSFGALLLFFSVIVVLDYFIHSTDLVSLYPYVVAVSVAHVSSSTSCFIWNEKCDINKILV